MYRQNLKKSLASIIAEVGSNSVFNFELFVFQKLRGHSRSASRFFPKSVMFAICILVGTPNLALYACSIVPLRSIDRLKIVSSPVDLYWLLID